MCGLDDRDFDLLICDGCDSMYHLGCLDPPLEAVPEEDYWYCPTCCTHESVKKRARTEATKAKSKKSPSPAVQSLSESDDYCFVCYGGGEVLVCEHPGCPKV